MRPRFAIAVVLLAMVPLAAGNAPPVAVADVQAEAVMGEPIVFSSFSYDPDGAIASTSWEFSDDGRTLQGETITKVLQFPGLHTIVLTVRDDLGATDSLGLQVLVHAPLMHGRATALRVGDSTFADTGDVATSQHTTNVASVGEHRSGQLRVAGLDADVRTLDDRTVARADVGYLYVPLPIGYILLTGVEAESIVGCGFPTIVNAKFTQLRLNDAPLVPPGEVPPNTRVELPGGSTLALNVQETTEDGRLAVTAARITTAQGVVEVARAEAGVDHCHYVS